MKHHNLQVEDEIDDLIGDPVHDLILDEVQVDLADDDEGEADDEVGKKNYQFITNTKYTKK